MFNLKSRKTIIGGVLIAGLAAGAALLYGPSLALDRASINQLSGVSPTDRASNDPTGANATIIDLAGNEVPVLRDGLTCPPEVPSL